MEYIKVYPLNINATDCPLVLENSLHVGVCIFGVESTGWRMLAYLADMHRAYTGQSFTGVDLYAEEDTPLYNLLRAIWFGINTLDYEERF